MSSPMPVPPVPLTSRVARLPRTPWGRRSAVLALIFVALFGINAFVMMPFGDLIPRPLAILYGWVMMADGLTCGATALLAVIRQGERSWVTALTLLPAVLIVFLLIGEVLVPH